MKKNWKSVKIWWSYHYEFSAGTLFWSICLLHTRSCQHKLISVQPLTGCCTRSSRSSSPVVTITRPSSSSSQKIENRSFQYVLSCLWNQLPASFRLPRPNHSPPHSSHPTHVSSFFHHYYYHCLLLLLFSLQTQTSLFQNSLPQTPPTCAFTITDSGLLNGFLFFLSRHHF